MDLNRVGYPVSAEQIAEISEELESQYTYHAWDEEMKMRGDAVRAILQAAALTIITNVPPSADRAVALRKLREARMDANSAITHGGKY